MSITSTLLSASKKKVWRKVSKGIQTDVKTGTQPKLGSRAEAVKHILECSFPYFDSHCHLDSVVSRVNTKEQTKFDWKSLANDRVKGNFDGALTICCDKETYTDTANLINGEHKKLYGGFGLHPHNAKEYDDDFEAKLLEAMKFPRTIAWGECGLDYYYLHSPKDTQCKVFARQIKRAVEVKKPLVVHSRDAEEDTIKILKEHAPKTWPIHVHCFTSSLAMAQTLLQHFTNLYFGFTGAITFGNASALRDVVAKIPLQRILLETDSPYMSPEPFRGHVAHPGHIPLIAAKIAAVKGVSLEEVCKQTRANVKSLYGV